VSNELPVQRVEVTFVGRPPAARVARASGVADVETDGRHLRCTVTGSFQPFLEALQGCEVLTLRTAPDVSFTPPPARPAGARPVEEP